MELAERERQLIRSRGSHHFMTVAARQNFADAWHKVDLIRKCFGAPSYVPEAN